jgi:ribosomal protein S26
LNDIINFQNKHVSGWLYLGFCVADNFLVGILQDKAVKRFLVRNIVEQAAVRDVQEACVYDGNFLHFIIEICHLLERVIRVIR